MYIKQYCVYLSLFFPLFPSRCVTFSHNQSYVMQVRCLFLFIPVVMTKPFVQWSNTNIQGYQPTSNLHIPAPENLLRSTLPKLHEQPSLLYAPFHAAWTVRATLRKSRDRLVSNCSPSFKTVYSSDRSWLALKRLIFEDNAFSPTAI